MAKESNLALVELLQERNETLNQHIGGLADQLDTERRELGRKDEEIKRLERRLSEQQSEWEAQRQRMDALQHEVDTKPDLSPSAAGLRADIETLEEQSRLPQTVFAEANTRLYEQAQKDRAEAENLQGTVAQLENCIQTQILSFNQDREMLMQQVDHAKSAQGTISDSLTKIMPHLRTLLAACGQEQRGADTDESPPLLTTTQANSSTVAATSEEAPNPRLVRILEQENNALRDQQEMRWLDLMGRGKLLTCPISLELFEDPVMTECCGKTFSWGPLQQAFEQNPSCPCCHANDVWVHINRDMAAIVELHRSERSALGRSRLAVFPTDMTVWASEDPLELQRAKAVDLHIRRSKVGSDARQIRKRELRSERVQARSALPHRLSKPRGCTTALTAVTKSNLKPSSTPRPSVARNG